jgi:hypothetical protein
LSKEDGCAVEELSILGYKLVCCDRLSNLFCLEDGSVIKVLAFFNIEKGVHLFPIELYTGVRLCNWTLLVREIQ